MGGSAIVKDNTEMYSFDFQKHNWQIIKPKFTNDANDIPQGRDDHSCAVYNNTMVIFGGFTTDGEPSNDVFKYHFLENKWERVNPECKELPSPRIGHSAVIYEDNMYVFGGKDTEERFDDMWKFDLKTNVWSIVDSNDCPVPRSGHTAQIWGQYMIIYGGFFAICQELNDMHVFDLKNEKWVCLFEELNSPMK